MYTACNSNHTIGNCYQSENLAFCLLEFPIDLRQTPVGLDASVSSQRWSYASLLRGKKCRSGRNDVGGSGLDFLSYCAHG